LEIAKEEAIAGIGRQAFLSDFSRLRRCRERGGE
jgi:hypothetical protein